jgi:hypothetical protein
MICDLEKQGHREAADIEDRDVELGVGARRVGCARPTRRCRDLSLHIDLGIQ